MDNHSSISFLSYELNLCKELLKTDIEQRQRTNSRLQPLLTIFSILTPINVGFIVKWLDNDNSFTPKNILCFCLLVSCSITILAALFYLIFTFYGFNNEMIKSEEVISLLNIIESRGDYSDAEKIEYIDKQLLESYKDIILNNHSEIIKRGERLNKAILWISVNIGLLLVLFIIITVV